MRTPFLALVLVVACAACSWLPVADDGGPVTTWAAADRVAAPAVVAATIAGEQLALADLDGVVVVNFWASWCGPCVEEIPHLQAIATQYADQGVQVVGVNSGDTSLANAQRFAGDNDLVFPSWFDPDEAIAASFDEVAPLGLPTTMILDAEHRVAVRFFGGITGATFAPYLEQVLSEASG